MSHGGVWDNFVIYITSGLLHNPFIVGLWQHFAPPKKRLVGIQELKDQQIWNLTSFTKFWVAHGVKIKTFTAPSY
jgi:hypothetical protein